MNERRSTESISFPLGENGSADAYFVEYMSALAETVKLIECSSINSVVSVLRKVIAGKGLIYVAGNGGSAAITNHLNCDFSKGISTDTSVFPRIFPLAAEVSLLTAIGNDISYDDVFSYQLSVYARPGDVLLTVSSSGNSENVVRAAKWAQNNGLPIIAFTGFEGGRSAESATVNLHVSADNYGVVEDTHQSLMHILAQYIRLAAMPASLISERTAILFNTGLLMWLVDQRAVVT